MLAVLQTAIHIYSYLKVALQLASDEGLSLVYVIDCILLCLFELMLYVPVNSNGNVGTLPPFYETFTQH